ncbi:orotate phosphoribosyltransferase [Buchnera aphidicola]|uniref:Orotate phosphoribosyltransferase n=1 Tax=Buchnera aphidicola (Sarucallis kahawaluokalani) TaxID=1241878 RepID=A0A4D6YKF2_9GAMM|nr:orotate phosphoribosyltransferase [Buchnera aphidicola]QCI26158.1 orotate phosphoribosyltransferase [Buchnera aphidicola (Sarucallis kahawaluokalani)]
MHKKKQSHMKIQKEKFIQLIFIKQALQFGQFKLKSNRYSPYFFNSHCFYNGADILQIGEIYSDMIYASKVHIDVIFGPAYKGIPLATATVIALKNKYNLEVPYFFDRKEYKQYSDIGYIIGKKYNKKKIVIIDDVITSGKTIQKSNKIINILKNQNSISGIFFLFDREEFGTSNKYTAKKELQKKYNCPIISMISITDIIKYCTEHNIYPTDLSKIVKYYQQYKPSNKINT